MMERVLEKIREERKRQDDKWGANRNLDDLVWLTILTEEVGESAEAILKDMPRNELESEVIQIAAVAVAWLENLQCPRCLICDEPEGHCIDWCPSKGGEG